MSDDIIEGLKRAASDDGLPLGFGAAEVVRVGRIRRRQRRAVGGSATVLGVAVVATAAWAVLPSSSEDSSEPAVHVETVPLDRGPMSAREAEKALDPICTRNVTDSTRIYARRVDSASGTKPAILATAKKPDGSLFGCGTTWSAWVPALDGDLDATPDAAHPIVSLVPDAGSGTTGGAWLSEGGFYRVADSVARVETRVGMPDGSEPWRVSKPRDGVVFWSAWIEEGAYDDDDEIWLQWRAYDTAGNLIDPALLPDEPRLIDPTGSNNVAAEYDETYDLFRRVAGEQLDPTGLRLEDASAGRLGSRDDSEWMTIATRLDWSPRRSLSTAVVELSLSRPYAYSDDELQARIGCGVRLECQRVDLGERGWAWVGENDTGLIGVGHVQPDGEIAYVVVDPDHPDVGNPNGEVHVPVDQAIAFVTDDRLDLP